MRPRFTDLQGHRALGIQFFALLGHRIVLTHSGSLIPWGRLTPSHSLAVGVGRSLNPTAGARYWTTNCTLL